MTAPRRPRPPAPRTVLIPPRQHCWVESDAFDRSAFAALVADTPSLLTLLERGGALVPHFREALAYRFVVGFDAAVF